MFIYFDNASAGRLGANNQTPTSKNNVCLSLEQARLKKSMHMSMVITMVMIQARYELSENIDVSASEPYFAVIVHYWLYAIRP